MPAWSGRITLERKEFDFRSRITLIGDAAHCAEWFVPTTRFRLRMSNFFWKILPYTPWRNMMIKLPTKLANSISLKDYEHKESPTLAHAD